METDTEISVILLNYITINPLDFNIIIGLFFLLMLLCSSALISSSEVAYFSLNPTSIKFLKENQSKHNEQVIKHLSNPEILLATILIANNFVNIAIVIISYYINTKLFTYPSEKIKFIFEAVIITFLILLFGEILPKVYANYYNKKVAALMAFPLLILEKIFKPLSNILIKTTSVVNKKIQKKQKISIEDLSDAIDITSNSISQEIDILQGIVKFGSIDVKEIMTPRLDVVSVDINLSFSKLKDVIVDSGYSRIPVYEENLDNIKGILYIKDLIKSLDKEEYEWKELIREPYFVPENKKIDDLLHEFQTKKIHLAIVSDEYGGIIGLISLEDILEEIVGEIKDEFDAEENTFIKIDESTYIFEGKTQLNDFYKIYQADENIFDDVKGDAETLAGLVLELRGDFPSEGEIISCHNFSFQIESVDNRKINRIKITKNPKTE